jgi:hypothetical protein
MARFKKSFQVFYSLNIPLILIQWSAFYKRKCQTLGVFNFNEPLQVSSLDFKSQPGFFFKFENDPDFIFIV